MPRPPLELRWPGKIPLDSYCMDNPYNMSPTLCERHQGGGGRLIHGDNLTLAPWLLQLYKEQVALVYMDPPFATGTRFSLTAAVGDETRAAAELDAYDDRLDDPGEFLAALAPRLVLAHQLLNPSGLFFLHLDARASHGAKLVLDEIFGPQAFRGEIVWIPGNGAKKKSFFALQHQVILAYSKGDSWTFHHDSPSLREPFTPGSLKSHFRHTDAEGRRFRRRVVGEKEYIYYADEGRQIGSVWADIPAMSAGSPVLKESTGYPTQKPIKLLERILLACSHPGDLVADLCFGSGTTLIAAERLGRRWLGCDLGAIAVHTARKRLLEINAPFSLWRTTTPVGPVLHASADQQENIFSVCIDKFHTDIKQGSKTLNIDGIALLDAWSVGTIQDGTFEGKWHVWRTRKRRELPWKSEPIVLQKGERPAVCALDLQGQVAMITL